MVDLFSSEVFWIGLAGIAATAATGIVAQVAQTRRLVHQLRQDRARHRYEELHATYRSASLALTRAITLATQPTLSELVIPEGTEIIDFFEAPMALRMAGASQQVLDSLEFFTDRLERAQTRRFTFVAELDDAILRARQRKFSLACASHLKSIWPDDQIDSGT